MEENRHTGPAYEATDVHVWAVGKFALALIAVILVSLGLLIGLFKYFQSREAANQAKTIEPAKVFPEPQLQTSPVLDLKAIRAEEDKLLNGYAWLDQKKGLVRIPIDQAIDLLARRGLPSRPATEIQTSASGVSVPTDSGPGIAAPKAPKEGAVK
jgi:hypothetical protein